MRFLFLPDLHQVFTNPNNRVDLISEGINTIDFITDNIIEKYNISGILQGGDLCDRGYKSVPTTINSEFIKAHERLSQKVNGHTYINIGNHEYNFSKDNPTFTIIDFQSERIKELYKYKPKPKLLNPIWKAVDKLSFGSVEIHFITYNPDRNYKILDNDDNKFIIGLYHDDLVSFESEMELYHHRLGHGISMSNTDIFDNVNIALLAHIHKPLTPFNLSNYRNTLIINPGSLISRTAAEKHEMVSLPVIDIGNDGVNLEFIEFKLPDFSESFIQEVVDENKNKYEMAKIMKETKSLGLKKISLDDIIKEVSDPEIRKLILDSKEPLVSLTAQEIVNLTY